MIFGEKPSKAAIASTRYLSYVFLIGAIAAAIAWMVYVAKWQIDVYNPVANGTKTALNARDELADDRYTICFQALVASVLFYIALRHMHHVMRVPKEEK